MVLDKIFAKKNSSSDLDVLKQRFSQVGDSPNQTDSQPNSDLNNTVGEKASSADVVIEDKIDDQEKSAEEQLFGGSGQQEQQIPQQPAQQDLQSQPNQNTASTQQPAPAGQPIGVVANSDGSVSRASQQSTTQPQTSSPQPVASQPVQSIAQDDLPSWAIEGSSDTGSSGLTSAGSSQAKPNAVTEKLEDIEDKYYDAKLNSLIIDQVKELIEIDNNLNNKIDDVGSEIKKEVQEREKLAKKVDSHLAKIKELEANMEKFLGLYEMVTNQFNPFVDTQDGATQHPQIAIPQPPQQQVKEEQKTVESTPSPQPSQPTPTQPPIQPVASPRPQEPTSQPQPNQNTTQLSHQGTVMPPLWEYTPLHGAIHPSMHFELKNGEKLSSIHDLLAVLEHMDDEMFRHHVSLRHNDFSNWVYRILGLPELGSQLDPIKTRPEMVNIIRSYIQDKMQKK